MKKTAREILVRKLHDQLTAVYTDWLMDYFETYEVAGQRLDANAKAIIEDAAEGLATLHLHE